MDDNARTIHQVAADLNRRQARATKPLTRRLADAMNRMALLTTVSANNVESGKLHALKPGTQLPPNTAFNDAGDLVTSVETFRAVSYLAAIEHTIERLELALDNEQGLGQARHHATKSGEELDEEIRAFRGIPAYVVAARAEWLGSPRTIERRRIAMGLKPSNGLEHEDKDRHAA